MQQLTQSGAVLESPSLTMLEMGDKQGVTDVSFGDSLNLFLLPAA